MKKTLQILFLVAFILGSYVTAKFHEPSTNDYMMHTALSKDNSIEPGISGKNIIDIAYTICDSSITYPDIPSLTENSEQIIYGEVQNIEYIMQPNGCCYTRETIRIIQSIKGAYASENTIFVLKDQGIMSVQQYIDSFQDESEREILIQNFSELYPDTDWNQIYFIAIEINDIMSEIGHKGIYFLEKSAFFDKDGSYCALDGANGEYFEIEENVFTKVSELSSVLGLWNYNASLSNSEPVPYTVPDECTYTTYTKETLLAECMAYLE